MLDFPSSPTNGQKFPVNPIPGVATYVWDNEKWTTLNPPSGTGVSQTYVDTQDNLKLAKAANLSDVADATTSRKSVYAAPFDALAYSGMQLNGSFDVSQERGFGTATTVGAAAFFLCDGWQSYKNGTMVVSGGTYTVPYFPSFNNYGAITVQTAQPTLTSNEYVFIFAAIEGYRIARLAWGTANAQPITIGFWTRHIRTGTYTGSVRNSAANRGYAFSYTQNVSDIPEYKVVTIPGCTDGVWEVTNLVGLSVTFMVAAGPSIISPSLNTWLNANVIAGPGQINGVAATSDVFRITGLVVLPGIEASSAARSAFITRPFDQELATCQRYYQKTYPLNKFFGSIGFEGAITAAAGAAFASRPFLQWRFPTRMRASPSIQGYSSVTGANGVAANLNAGTDVVVTLFSSSDLEATCTPNGTPAAGAAFSIHFLADARI